MPKVKICGLTNLEDAMLADQSGADYLGFIFVPSSKRFIPEEKREWIRNINTEKIKVGVFQNESAEKVNSLMREFKLDIAQLHGNENYEYIDNIQTKVWKVITIENALSGQVIQHNKIEHYIIDTVIGNQSGGTGKSFDWNMMLGLNLDKPFFVAGGITPENVTELLSLTKIFGIDVSSGVEETVGRKSEQKLKLLFDRIR